jgi:hypothetical protein
VSLSVWRIPPIVGYVALNVDVEDAALVPVLPPELPPFANVAPVESPPVEDVAPVEPPPVAP